MARWTAARTHASRRTVWTLLPVAMVAAGCFDDGSKNGPPTSGSGATHEEQPSARESALLDSDTDTLLGSNEPHMAVNPLDTQVIAISQCQRVLLSFDGGATFPTTVNLQVPAKFAFLGCDDVVTFDSKGRLFVTWLAFVVGNNAQDDVLVQHIDARRPGPGVNDNARLLTATGVNCVDPLANQAQCPVDVSSVVVPALDACHDNVPGRSSDRQWFVADIRPACATPPPDRTTRTCSPFQDTLYLVWLDSPCTGDVRPQTARVATSSDQGATWTTQSLTDPGDPTMPAETSWQYGIGIAANGDAYVAGHEASFGQVALFRSTTGTAAGFAGNPTAPFPNPTAQLSGNQQQCSCGNGVCRSDPSKACSFTPNSCPGNPVGDAGVGCECPANDCVPPGTAPAPGSCANVPIPGWQMCADRSTTTPVFAVGGWSPYVVADPTNPNNVAVFSGTDPNPGVTAVDKYDVKYSLSTNATSAVPSWSTPIAVTPGGLALPGTNQLFPQAINALPGTNGSCVTLAYYDDRNPTTPNAQGHHLLDVFVTVHPNLWDPNSSWQSEAMVNHAPFDPDIPDGNDRQADYCGVFGGTKNNPPINCPPAGWVRQPRVGEYYGLLQALGIAWTGNSFSGGTPVNQEIYFNYSDGIKPVVTPPAPATVNSCTPSAASLGSATATDVCGMAPLTLLPPTPAVLVRGANTVTWSAKDGANNKGTATQAVTVNDTTPPSIVAPPTADVPVCNPTGGVVVVGTATATDDCGGTVTITGSVIKKNGVTLTPPITVVNGQVTLGFGVYIIQWTASDGITTSMPALQTVTVGPKIQAAGSFILDDTSFVKDTNGSSGQVFNSGATQTRLGVNASSASITSVASVTLSNNSHVNGNIVTSGTISGPTGGVTGTRTTGATVTLPALPALPPFPAPVGSDIFVNAVTSLTPGSYPSVYVNSGGTLILAAGDFFFQNLFINSTTNVRVQVSPNTRVFIRTQFAFRTPFLNSSNAVQPILLGFAGTTLTVETNFKGTLIAPNGSVTFGLGAAITYQGSFYAKSIELRNNTTMTCDEALTPPFPTNPLPSGCSDGTKNGTETDVDCGGNVCASCADGLHCNVNGDCRNGTCTAGLCQAPTGRVAATLRITTDWGTGYCATIQLTNFSPNATTNWSTTVNLSQSTTYTTWNGNFSGNTGSVTIAPGFSWNQRVLAGATDSSVGFCANRTPPNSGALPTLLSATGTF